MRLTVPSDGEDFTGGAWLTGGSSIADLCSVLTCSLPFSSSSSSSLKKTRCLIGLHIGKIRLLPLVELRLSVRRSRVCLSSPNCWRSLQNANSSGCCSWTGFLSWDELLAPGKNWLVNFPLLSVWNWNGRFELLTLNSSSLVPVNFLLIVIQMKESSF